MSLFSKCEHDWQVVRVAHFTISRANYESDLGPWSRLHRKCSKCEKLDTIDKRGRWKVEDFDA